MAMAITEVTAATGGTNICFGGAYITLGNIRVAEGHSSDFGSSFFPVTFELSAPDNFDFEPGVGEISRLGTKISDLSINISQKKITVTYTLTNSSGGELDGFIISGIKVKAISVSSGQILRTGGTAYQFGNFGGAGNPQVNHGTLTSYSYPLPVANAGVDAAIELGNSTLIGGDPSASGSTSPYLYEWWPVTGLSSPSDANPTAAPQSSTTYTLKITDANGCTDTDEVLVTVNGTIPDGPIITTSGSTTICNGESVTLYSSETTGNQWYKNGSEVTGATGSSLTVSTTGLYTVAYFNGTLTSNHSDPTEVKVNPIPANRTIVAEKTNLCYLGSTFIEIRTSVNGIEYQLRRDGVNTGSPVAGNGGSIYLATGQHTEGTYTYSVIATNSVTFCTRVMSTIIDIVVEPGIPTPAIMVDPSQTICGSGTITLSTSPGYDNYLWYRNDVFYYSSGSNELVLNNPESSGKFKVRIFKNSPLVCGSSFSASVDLNLYAQPLQKNLEAEKSLICSGESAKILVLNSEIGVLYSLKYNANTEANGAPVAGTGSTLVLPSGALNSDTTFVVLAENGLTGCSVEMSIKPVIFISPNLTLTASTLTESVCLNGTKTIQLKSVFEGGTGIKTISWTGPDGFSSNLQDPLPFVPLTTGDHTYTVNITDEAGCTSSSEVVVEVKPVPVVYSFNNSNNNTICLGDEVRFTAFGAEKYEFRINGQTVQPWSTNNTFITSSITDGGTVCVQGLNSNGCTSFTAEETFVVHAKPDAYFTGLNTEYCVNDGPVILIGQPEGGSFSGSGMRNNEFIPEFAGAGIHQISYTNIRSETGCDSTFFRTVIVKPVPVAEFSYISACVGGEVQFEDKSTPSTEIVSWTWNFGDGNQDVTIQNPAHSYLNAGVYNVSLSVTSSSGCIESITKEVVVGEIPQPQFFTTSICYGTSTQFTDASQGDIVSYSWSFGDPLSGFENTSSLKNPQHLFSGIGSYEVTLAVGTSKECYNSITKTVHILPAVGANNFPYHEDFENSNGGWVSGGKNSSWQHESPTGKILHSAGSGLKAWATMANSGSYYDDEQSFVLSPCFDFSTLKRPMLSFRIFSHTDKSIDGAVMQYSLDDGITWKRLGNIGDGISWYNQGSIVSQPGGFSIGQEGWSGKETEWKIAKFNLDFLKNQPSVKFRISFASVANNLQRSDQEGFAFDDVYIGERSRLVVLEHFTNSSSLENEQADAYVNTLTENNLEDVTSIHYHTSAPYTTPLNLDNTADPSVKSQYYGISQTPRAVLDGNYFNGKSMDWTQGHLKYRSLIDPVFDIEVTLPTASIEELFVEAKVTALKEYADEVVVHIAVIEEEVYLEDGKLYKNILKKLLPDGAGTIFQNQWSEGISKTLTTSWNVRNLYGTEDKPLKVIVYVQNNITKEILQAEYVKTSPKRNQLTTDISEEDKNGKQEILKSPDLRIFPVPGNTDVYCTFDAPLTKDHTWRLTDQRGIQIIKGTVNAGSEELVFDVRMLPSGMYYLRLSSYGNEIINKKILVRH